MIAFIATAYFCKCYTSSVDVLNVFKEVGIEADNHLKVTVSNKPVSALNGGSGLYATRAPAEDSKADWTEMQDMPSPHSGKKIEYERSVSKDSIQSLIKRKTVDERGTSESTSGCDSGQNYESDEMDNNSARSGSQGPNSVNSENVQAGEANRGESIFEVIKRVIKYIFCSICFDSEWFLSTRF